MKKELSTTEMFYGILNQRGIAMLIEQALMVACVKIAGIEDRIASSGINGTLASYDRLRHHLGINPQTRRD